MEAAHIPRRLIGELLVEKGVITEEQLEQALAEQAETGLPLGEVLVSKNLISSPELTEALDQLGQQVVKEEGYGSGLWSEIRRRNGHAGTPKVISPADVGRSFGGPLSRALGTAPEQGPEADAHATELEADDIDEIRSELKYEASAPVALHPRGETIEPLTRSLEEANSRLEEQEHALADRDTVLQAARTDVAELREQVSEQVEIVVEIRERFASLAAAASESQSAGVGRASELEHELEAARDRIGELEARESGLAAQVVAVEKAFDDEQRAHVQARREAEQAGTESAQLRELVLEVERGLEALQAERDSARSELAIVSEQAREASEERVAVVERLEEEFQDVESQLETARREGKQALAELADVQADAEALRGLVSELEEQVATLLSSLHEEIAGHADARDALAQALAELDAGRAVSVAAEARPNVEYLCFAPGKDGYRLVPQTGCVPAAGNRVDLDGTIHVVTRVGGSPLPADDRRCVYLQAAA